MLAGGGPSLGLSPFFAYACMCAVNSETCVEGLAGPSSGRRMLDAGSLPQLECYSPLTKTVTSSLFPGTIMNLMST